MTKNNVQDGAYVFQFNDSSYLSWHDVNGRYTFGVTPTFINAEMFESTNDLPEWVTTYLSGTFVKVNLEVTE